MPGNTTDRGLFQLGKYWIDYLNPEEPGGNLYRFWYDGRVRTNRRRSLGTEDLEQAKEKLAQIVIEGRHAQADPKDPSQVGLLTVIDHYLTHHAPILRNQHMADRAAALFAEFIAQRAGLGERCTVKQFSFGEQRQFVTYCHANYGHSVGHLTRIMGVLSAAYNHAAKPVMVTNPDGEDVDVVLLDFVPFVMTSKKDIAKLIDAPEAAPLQRIPSIEEMASFLDSIEEEHTFRYCIIALNTWARPEAITDLRVSKQVDRGAGLINLLPPGKAQTKKRRPLLKLTENLSGWLDHWGQDAPIQWRGRTIKSSRKGFEKAYWRAALKSLRYTDRQIRHVIQDRKRRKAAVAFAVEKGFPEIIRYTLRHFMATRVQAVVLADGTRVPREQRQIWLGHAYTDTTSTYEHHNPDYLKECAAATDSILRQLDEAATRNILPPAQRQQGATTAGNLEVIEGGRS